MRSARWIFVVSLAGFFAQLGAMETAHAETAPKDAPAAAKPEPPVSLETEDHEEKARILFKEARALVEQGQFPKACPKFEESLRLHMGMGTRFNLADCWERIGRTASAYQLFELVAESAMKAGQYQRAEAADERAKKLESRLSRFLIQVESPPKGLEIRRNAKRIPQNELGIAVPIDPGTYMVVAEAPGKQTWSAELDVRNVAGVVSITVPELEPAKAGAARTTSNEEASEEESTSSEASTPEDQGTESTNGRTAAYGIGALGAASLLFGGYMALEYRSSNNDAKDVCPSGQNCTRDEINRHDELVNSAEISRNLAWVGGGVGVAALASAVYLYLRSDQESSTVASRGVTNATVVASKGAAGVLLQGTW